MVLKHTFNSHIEQNTSFMRYAAHTVMCIYICLHELSSNALNKLVYTHTPADKIFEMFKYRSIFVFSETGGLPFYLFL